MPEPVPSLEPLDLARRLDRGEALQIVDIRAAARVAQSRVRFGAALDFRALPGSELYALPSLDPLGLDPGRPVAVVCGHGNSSVRATAFLRARGFEAYSLTGGMARWETVYVPRRLASTPSVEHVVQLDRVGKGCLSYVLASGGEAVVVDPGRHMERYDVLLRELAASPVAVIDTHMHADYLSGARGAAERWGVPYYLHPEDAVSPYDGAPGRFAYQPLTEERRLAFGRATLRVERVPGHTLGSVALVADDDFVLTGDFLFVASVGRPDLGDAAEAWTRLLWRSLDRARRTWPGDLLVLPAHYAAETERRADRAVGARFDVIRGINEPVRISDEVAFLRWVARHHASPPEAYRTMKLANLGLVTLSDAEVEEVEFGPNQCAVG